MFPKLGVFRAVRTLSGALTLTVAAHLIVALLALPASPSFAASPPQSPAHPFPPQTSQAPQATDVPEATCPPGGQCFADVPSGNPFYEFTNRIYMQDLVTGYACGGPGEPCDGENRPYYRPGGLVTRQQMAKFIDSARRLPEIHIDMDSSAPLIYARNTVTSAIHAETLNSVAIYAKATGASGRGVKVENTGGGVAVEGISNSAPGLRGVSSSGYGVLGTSTSGHGVYGTSTSGYGVYAVSSNSYGLVGFSNTSIGVYGNTNDDAGEWAGYFTDNVHVTGNLSKGGGSFKIDHPLDPADKYLYHSFVESPDMLNIYRGTVSLDIQGEAVVRMPDWFEALNRDFDYQLTAIGAPGPDLYIAEEIKSNAFKIAGGKAGMKVSWQVTGTRQDPYANAHRIPVEQDKPADEQGKYLHPTEWGQPASSGIDYEEQQRMQEQLQQVGER